VDTNPQNAKNAVIVAVPETAGSALYGMLDVLASAGSLWQQLVGVEPEAPLISPKVASPIGRPFECGNGIPVKPDLDIKDHPPADIVILPELCRCHHACRDRIARRPKGDLALGVPEPLSCELSKRAL
jgi:hypothetical protein